MSCGLDVLARRRLGAILPLAGAERPFVRSAPRAKRRIWRALDAAVGTRWDARADRPALGTADDARAAAIGDFKGAQKAGQNRVSARDFVFHDETQHRRTTTWPARCEGQQQRAVVVGGVRGRTKDAEAG